MPHRSTALSLTSQSAPTLTRFSPVPASRHTTALPENALLTITCPAYSTLNVLTLNTTINATTLDDFLTPLPVESP